MSEELASARGRWSGWRVVMPECGCAEEADGVVVETGARKEPRQVGKPPGLGRSGDLNTPTVSIHRAYQVLLAGILATGADPSPA